MQKKDCGKPTKPKMRKPAAPGKTAEQAEALALYMAKKSKKK